MILSSALANGLLQTIVPTRFAAASWRRTRSSSSDWPQVVGALVAGSVARAVSVDWAIGGAAALAMLLYARAIFARNPEVERL